jgi:hypothetical protein
MFRLLCSVAVTQAVAMLLTGCQSESDFVRFEASPHAIAGHAVGTAKLLFGSGGNVEMIVPYQDGPNTRLEAYSSRSRASVWTDGGPISPAGADIDGQGENSPRFAMDHNELLYALWRQETPKPQIYLAVYDWRVKHYTAPIRVRDANAKGYAGFADLGVGPDNTVYIVWLDERNKNASDSSSVYLAMYRNGRVSRNIEVATSTCPCCRPTVAVSADGTVYVAWRHDDHDLRDIAVASSRDQGRSFSPFHDVAHDGWRLHGCPESGPSLLVEGRRLYVAWYTQGRDARSRVNLSFSDDHGQSFAAPVEISAGTLDANHPHLFSLQPSGVGVIFQARDGRLDNGWSAVVPYLVRLRADGTPTQPLAAARPGERDATEPDAVAPDAQSMFVAYALATHAMMVRGRL